MVSLHRLRQVLDYNPCTGVFKWKVTVGRGGSGRLAGEEAGSLRSGKVDYVLIRVDGCRYYAHRLAWFYVYGRWPKRLDHKDRRGQNNAIKNLREATVKQNLANRCVQSNNRLGVKGVRLRRGGSYEARINLAGKQQVLGYFRTAEEAHTAYLAALKSQYGEFAIR
jgi:hypothetical protein